jgi:hypothetical protein
MIIETVQVAFDCECGLVVSVVNALNSSLKCVRPDASLGVRIP